MEREREGTTRGSRSTEPLFIDLKVKILACNVEALKANPECVQVLLGRAREKASKRDSLKLRAHDSRQTDPESPSRGPS